MRQQKEDSYLHPRQLEYKRSPETRNKSNKKNMKDAATVNTCTVKTHKPEIESERERKREQSEERDLWGQQEKRNSKGA